VQVLQSVAVVVQRTSVIQQSLLERAISEAPLGKSQEAAATSEALNDMLVIAPCEFLSDRAILYGVGAIFSSSP